MASRARHRSPIIQKKYWKWEYRYWQNQWYLHGRPVYRRVMRTLGLRK